MKKTLLLLTLLLAACGGGGGGGGGSGGGSGSGSGSGSGAPTNNNTGNQTGNLNTGGTSLGSGSSTPGNTGGTGNSINTACNLSQNIGTVPRNDGLRIAAVNYLQVAQQNAADSSSRIASGKPLRIRVDILANTSVVRPNRIQMVVYNPSTRRCESYPITGPTRLPTTIDSSSLSNAFTALIPAAAVQPNMAIGVLVDDGSSRTSAEASETLKIAVPGVLTGRTETIRIIPLQYEGELGYATPSLVKDIIERTYGLSEVIVRTEEPFFPPSFNSSGGLLGSLGLVDRFNNQTMREVLSDVDDECRRLNGRQANAVSSPKCIGVFPDNVNFSSSTLLNSGSSVVGIAFIGGVTMVAQSFNRVDETSVSSPYSSSHWLNFRALTIAHEFGHLMGMRHANCGVAGDDTRLYSDGRIGPMGAGYDEKRNFYFSATRLLNGAPQFSDLMSYCRKEWPSDLAYRATLAYRAAGASSQVAAREVGEQVLFSSAERWMRLRLLPNGRWQSKVVDYPPTHLVDSALSLQLMNVAGQPKIMLQSAEIADMEQLPTSGPYFVKLPDSSVAIDNLSWQIISNNNNILAAGVGQVLSPR